MSDSIPLRRLLNGAGVVVSLSATPANGSTTIRMSLIDRSRRWPQLSDFGSREEYFTACEAIDRAVCEEFGITEKHIHVNSRGDLLFQVFQNNRRDSAIWRFGFGIDSPNSPPGCDGSWTT